MLDLMLGSRLKRMRKRVSFCVEFYLIQTAASRLFIFMHPCTHLEVYLDSMWAGKLVWISYKQKDRLNCQIISLKKENKNHNYIIHMLTKGLEIQSSAKTLKVSKWVFH